MKSIEQPSTQFDAFKCRINANLHILRLNSECMQYWIQRPQLMPIAMDKAFRSYVVSDADNARRILERYLWRVKYPYSGASPQLLEKSRKLLIWFLRQSKDLNEEIVLHSPFDPDDKTEEIIELATTATFFTNMLGSSNAKHLVEFGFVMRGVGCMLDLHATLSDKVAHLYLTFHGRFSNKPRRIYWKDAMEGIASVEEPKDI